MEELTADLKDNGSKQGVPIGTVMIILAVVVLLAGVTGLSVYMYIKANPQVLGLNQNNTTLSDEEQVLTKLGELVLLPEGETPEVKTIDDLGIYKDQSFFENAKEGDKIIIYKGAQKVYLYRPSDERIVEVGMLSEASSINEATDSAESENGEVAVEKISPTITGTTVKKLTPTPTSSSETN